MNIKAIASIFGIVVVLLGSAVGYGELKKGQKDTEKKVEEIIKDVDENENVNIAQSVILEQIGLQLSKNNLVLDELLRKIYSK